MQAKLNGIEPFNINSHKEGDLNMNRINEKAKAYSKVDICSVVLLFLSILPALLNFGSNNFQVLGVFLWLLLLLFSIVSILVLLVFSAWLIKSKYKIENKLFFAAHTVNVIGIIAYVVLNSNIKEACVKAVQTLYDVLVFT